jgi:signal transduction histidine kinase
LPIVRAIAEAHGGAVSVESEPGAGTTFALTLGTPVPAARGAAAAAPELRPAAA